MHIRATRGCGVEEGGSDLSECEQVSKLTLAPAELFIQSWRAPRRAPGGWGTSCELSAVSFHTGTGSEFRRRRLALDPGDRPPRMLWASLALPEALPVLHREVKLNILCITRVCPNLRGCLRASGILLVQLGNSHTVLTSSASRMGEDGQALCPGPPPGPRTLHHFLNSVVMLTNKACVVTILN